MRNFWLELLAGSRNRKWGFRCKPVSICWNASNLAPRLRKTIKKEIILKLQEKMINNFFCFTPLNVKANLVSKLARFFFENGKYRNGRENENVIILWLTKPCSWILYYHLNTVLNIEHNLWGYLYKQFPKIFKWLWHTNRIKLG